MGLIVIDSGFWTTVQDGGRVGYREWGVPPGGAFDRGSAELANGLVGNTPDCATLELTLRGGTFEALGNLGLGLAGAPMEASILGNEHPSAAAPGATELHPGRRRAPRAGADGFRSANLPGGEGGLPGSGADGKPLHRRAAQARRFSGHQREHHRLSSAQRTGLEGTGSPADPDRGRA